MRIRKIMGTPPNTSWDQDFDRATWSHDICLRTEADLLFRSAGKEISHSLFALEFFLELSAIVLRTLGGLKWNKQIALPLSGTGFSVVRDSEKIRFYHRDEVISEMNWVEFLDAYAAMKSELKNAMSVAFPKLSESPEFKLLFGEVD